MVAAHLAEEEQAVVGNTTDSIFTFDPPGDLFSLLPISGSVAVVLPDHVDPSACVQAMARRLPDGPGTLYCGRFIDVPGIEKRSFAEFRSARDVRRLFSSPGRRKAILCDLTTTAEGWERNTASLLTFLEDARRICRENKARWLLMIASRFLPPEENTAILGGYDCVIEFFAVGPWLYAQVRSCKGATDPVVFLPRPIKFSANDVKFGEPVLPVPGGIDRHSLAFLELYKQALNGMTEGIILFDPRGGFREANRRALEMLGITGETLSVASVRRFVSQASYAQTLRLISSVRRKIRAEAEIVLANADGKELRVHVEVTAPSARVGVAVMRSRDRRGRDDGRQQLPELRERLQRNPVPQAMFLAKNMVDANAAFREMFARVLAGEESPTLLQILGRDAVGLVRSMIRVLEPDVQGDVSFRDVSIPLAEGDRRVVDLIASKMSWSGKKSLLVTVIDQTERVERLQASVSATHGLTSIVESNVIACLVVRDGTIVRGNRSMVSLLGVFSTEDLAGKELVDFLAPRDRKSIPAKVASLQSEEGVPSTFECTFLGGGGKPIRAEVVAERIDYEGSPAILACVRVAAGKQKSTEELRQRLDEAGRLEKITAAVRHADNLETLLQSALRACLTGLGFDAGGAYGSPGADGMVRLQCSEGLPDLVVQALEVQPTHEGLTGFVARTLEPLHLLMSSYPPHLPFKALFGDAGFSTIIVLPLCTGGQLHATLVLCNAKPLDPTDFSSDFFPRVARALGAAVNNVVIRDSLARAKAMYAGLVGGMHDVAYRLAPSGKVEFVSPAIERLLGYPAAEFYRIPDLWRECVHPDDRLTYSQRMSDSASDKAGGELHYRMLPRGKAGYKSIRDAFSYLRNDTGQLIAIVGSFGQVTDASVAGGIAAQDIPKNRPERAEEEGLDGTMGASARTLQAVLDNMGDVLIITDLQGRIATVNKEFARLTGYSRRDAVGITPPYPWLLEQEMGKMMEWISAMRASHTLRDFDMTWVRKDGHHIAISLNTTLLYNSQGDPRAMVNIARNISERKALEKDYRQQISRVSMLSELGEGLTASLDTGSILSQVTAQTMRHMHGKRSLFTASDDLGRLTPAFVSTDVEGSFVSVPPTDEDSRLAALCGQRLGATSSMTDPVHHILAAAVRGKERRHGALVLVGDEESEYGNADLRLLESIATLTGIALDRAQLYEETLKKSAEIQARNRELDDFTYVVSHDLKEPLITIEGYGQIVRTEFAERMGAEADGYVASMIQAAERMKRLIDDLLALSRVGRALPELESVSVDEILGTILRDLDYSLKERHATVEHPGMLPVVRYSPAQLGLILRNLISNGIKFNRSENPLVRVQCREEESEYVFSVTDNGIGIPEEYHERIFAIFQRLHPIEEYPGTGAGLTIVKKIVEGRGGRIWLESTVDKGTTVLFSIPK